MEQEGRARLVEPELRFGNHQFHLLDLIGDALVTTWRGRQAVDWVIIARRLVKLSILALTIIAMIYVLYPTQKSGWLLWLGNDKAELAHWTAVVLVGFTAVLLPAFRYAWENRHKALASLGGFLAVALLTTVLMGTWNFYSFASSRAVATSLTATGGAEQRIKDAERRLRQIDNDAAAAGSRFDSELARTPANYATARSRILNAQTAARQAVATERVALQAELRDARAANVTVNTTVADPRPIDQFISNVFRTERTGTGVALDLWRSLVFELIALLGVALSTAVVIGVQTRTHVIWGDRTPLGDDRAIPDLRAEQKVERTPWGIRERVIDNETGEELVEVRGHRKRKGKRKTGMPQPATIETPPISLPDETGVQSGADSRVARSLSWPEEKIEPADIDGDNDERSAHGNESRYNHDNLESDFEHDAPSLFGDPAPGADAPAPVVEAEEIAPANAVDDAVYRSTERSIDDGEQVIHSGLTDEELELLAEEEQAA